MAKRSKNTTGPKQPRGRKSHFNSAQSDFLKPYLPRWEAARQSGTISKLYNTVTTDFILRFGYEGDAANNQDGQAGLQAFDHVDGEKVPGTTGLTEEEAATKIKYYESLRAVRSEY